MPTKHDVLIGLRYFLKGTVTQNNALLPYRLRQILYQILRILNAHA